MPHFKLVSFALCPFVQRSVITLKEKSVDFEVEYIDLRAKPEWFLKISPLGKVPVLVVDGDTYLFESAVINEYLDEVTPAPRLLPEDPLRRAYGRAWIELSSNLLLDMYNTYTAKEEQVARDNAVKVRDKLAKLEVQLPAAGPYFYGAEFSLVDAATLPSLQRLGWIDEIEPSLAIFEGVPKVVRWRDAMLARPSVQTSAPADLREASRASMKRLESWLGRNLP